MKYSNHARFADDTIARRFNSVMSTFLKATEGKINSTKSKVYGWNRPTRTLENTVRTLGLEGNVTWNSFNYLGIPIFKGKKKGG